MKHVQLYVIIMKRISVCNNCKFVRLYVIIMKYVQLFAINYQTCITVCNNYHYAQLYVIIINMYSCMK